MDGAAPAGSDALARHLAAFRPVTDCPIRSDGTVELLADASVALRAMWAAMAAARTEIVLEFYTFEDLELDGVTLGGLLARKLREGVRVWAIYDAIGSDKTRDGFFDELRAAGAATVEFRSLNPLRRTFSLRANDRDHRKILVVDGTVAFLGGVNLDRQYLNPRSAGVPADGDTSRAFWQDAAARFTGSPAADARALFFRTWDRYGGAPHGPPVERPRGAATPDPAGGRELVCVEGSAPREGEPLHIRALFAALEAARSEVWIASGYFVPMASEVRALCRAARRGVAINLVLPGVSDVPGAVHAARATYGRLLAAGVRIGEMRTAVLHAKVATVDGVWTSVGSSNLDRRSAVMNNEVDAVVLGSATAAAMAAALRDWMAEASAVTLAGWKARSLHEHAGELAALLWKRLM